MYTLEITESAEADLDQITEYLGIELSNPPAALAVLDEVGQVSDALEVTPEMFPLWNHEGTDPARFPCAIAPMMPAYAKASAFAICFR